MHLAGAGADAASTSPASKSHPRHPAQARHPRGNEGGSLPTSRRRPESGVSPSDGPPGAPQAALARLAAPAVAGASRRASIACGALAASAAIPRCRMCFSACSLGQMRRYREIRRAAGQNQLRNRVATGVIRSPEAPRGGPTEMRRYSPCSGAVGNPPPLNAQCGCDGRRVVIRTPLHWRREMILPVLNFFQHRD